MTTQKFEKAFAFTIKNESTRYVNDPKDSGGPTKFGITKKTYEAFHRQCVPDSVIENLVIEDAKKIYFENYWKKINGDLIKSSTLATAIFDTAVLYGIGTAGAMVQKAANLLNYGLKVDGKIGDKTLDVLDAFYGNEGDFLLKLHSVTLVRIAAVCAQDPKNERFRNGWTNRADKVLQLATLTKGRLG